MYNFGHVILYNDKVRDDRVTQVPTIELSLNIVCEIDFMHTLVINFIDPVQMNFLLP